MKNFLETKRAKIFSLHHSILYTFRTVNRSQIKLGEFMLI